MRGEDLFNAMSGIDDELLIQSESESAASYNAPGDNTDVVHNGSKEQNAGGEPGSGNKRRGGGKVIPGWAVFALTAAACLAIVFVTRDAGRSGMDRIDAGNSAVMSSDQARMDGEVSPQEDPAEAAPEAEEADQVLQEAEEAAEQPQSDAGGADGKTQKTEEGTAGGLGADQSGQVQKPAPEQETAQENKKENIGGQSQDSGNKAGYAGQSGEDNADEAEKAQPAEDERAQEAEMSEADPQDASSHEDEAAIADETDAEKSGEETAAEDNEAEADSGEDKKDADAAGDASRDEETAEKEEDPAEVSTDKTKEQAESKEDRAAEAEQSSGEEEEKTDKSRTSADLLGEHKGSYVKLEYISASDEAKGAERTEPEYSEEGEEALRVIFDSSHSTDKNEGDKKKQKEKESAQKDKTADKGPAIYYMYLTDENGGSERIIFYKKNCVTMDSRPGEVIRVRESEYNDVLKLFK